MSDNVESGMFEGFKEFIKTKPAMAVVALITLVFCGAITCATATILFIRSPITTTIGKKLSPNEQPAVQAGGFIPFAEGDCDVGGDFPAPDSASLTIYPTNIYCPFMLTGTAKGMIYLTVDYEPDLANSPFASFQQGWQAGYQSAEKIKGGTNFTLVVNPPEQETVIVVATNTGLLGTSTDADIEDLRLYKDHFIIEIVANLTNCGGADAQPLDDELVQYATRLADKHYK